MQGGVGWHHPAPAGLQQAPGSTRQEAAAARHTAQAKGTAFTQLNISRSTSLNKSKSVDYRTSFKALTQDFKPSNPIPSN